VSACTESHQTRAEADEDAERDLCHVMKKVQRATQQKNYGVDDGSGGGSQWRVWSVQGGRVGPERRLIDEASDIFMFMDFTNILRGCERKKPEGELALSCLDCILSG